MDVETRVKPFLLDIELDRRDRVDDQGATVALTRRRGVTGLLRALETTPLLHHAKI